MQIAPFDGWVKRDGLEETYPRALSAQSVGSSGIAWNWSAYGTIVASTLEAFIPHRLMASFRAQSVATAITGVIVEYEIATGAVAAEVPLASFTFSYGHFLSAPGASTVSHATWGQTVPFACKVIPSGTRLSHRIRISEANTVSLIQAGTYIIGYKADEVPALYRPYSLRAHRAGVHEAVSVVETTGAKINVTSSWTQILASAPEDLLFWGASREQTALFGSNTILNIGTGGAGSEVARAKLPFPGGGIIGGTGHSTLAHPLLVKKGERLAAIVDFGSFEDYMFHFEKLPG